MCEQAFFDIIISYHFDGSSCVIYYSKKQQFFIDKVVSFAKNISDNGFQQKVAAAIVYKNKIISISHNKDKSHTFQKEFSSNDEAIYVHAETSVIHKALKLLGPEKIKKSSLIVVRISNLKNKSGRKVVEQKIANSKPCEGCSRCISTFGIKNVLYSGNAHFHKLN